MMSDDEIIAVVQAHKEGKRIQSRHLKDPKDLWGICPDKFEWNFGVYDYRVAPEPRKPREWVIPEGNLHSFGRPPYIKVREVIET